MHSRIYQIEENLVEEDDYISEERYFDNFVGSIADYVSEDTNREEDIKWFIDIYSKYGLKYDEEKGSIKFLDGFKERYFKNRFGRLKERVEKLTLEEFINDNIAYDLSTSIEDKFGFYVDGNGDYYKTIDEFVRNLIENKEYYFGGTIDYHY